MVRTQAGLMYVAIAHKYCFALHKIDMIWVFIGHARGWAPLKLDV